MTMQAEAPIKERFMYQHIWKTGGSEFCHLVRANGWSAPAYDKCDLFMNSGWPKEDHDIVFNERPLMTQGNGKLITDFVNISTAGDEIPVRNVKWVTSFRHPYSRSLSHFYHMLAVNNTQDFTIRQFLTHYSPRGGYDFWNYIPNQQTRWHCGMDEECTYLDLNPDQLVRAMAHLDQFHVVLILEDMKDPNSCTRLQMRHVMNLTKVEVLEELKKTNETEELKYRLKRHHATNWYKEFVPHLGPLVYEDLYNGTTTTTWDELATQVLTALALQNDMDLQLYGYARKLCQERGITIQNKLLLLLQQQQQNLTISNTTTLSSSSRLDQHFGNSAWTGPPAPSTVVTMQLGSLVILGMLMLPFIRRLRIDPRAMRVLRNQ